MSLISQHSVLITSPHIGYYPFFFPTFLLKLGRQERKICWERRKRASWKLCSSMRWLLPWKDSRVLDSSLTYSPNVLSNNVVYLPSLLCMFSPCISAHTSVIQTEDKNGHVNTQKTNIQENKDIKILPPMSVSWMKYKNATKCIFLYNLNNLFLRATGHC